MFVTLAAMPSTLDLAVLDHRVRTLEQQMEELRAARRPPHRDPEVDAHNLWEALTARGPLLESTARRMYSKAAVSRAIALGLVHRNPVAWPRMLSAERPVDSAFGVIASALENGPQPMAMLRTLDGVNKNTIADVILRGIHEGHFRRGNLQTGKAGRPQIVVARADKPLPTHWDTHKVDWDRA